VKKSRNQDKLNSFFEYCLLHPEERFWQALRNWAGVNFVGVSNDRKKWTDTFYDE